MRSNWIVIVGLLALCCCSCHGQDDTAKHETERRGNHVEYTGAFRSSSDYSAGLRAAALAPPADDSDKWYATLVIKPGESKSEALRQTIANDPEVKRWINTGDAGRSHFHFRTVSVDDPTQASWLAGVTSNIQAGGLPMLVIQPPRSGKFGDTSTVVKTLHGNLPGKTLSDKVRESIVMYVDTIADPEKRKAIGVAPPFNVQPSAPPNMQPAPLPPVQPGLPFEYPPARALTMDQIQAACPGATPEFLISVMTSKETNLEMVRLQWLIYQKDHPATPAAPVQPSGPACPVVPEDCLPNPKKPATQFPQWTLALAMAMGGLGAGLLGAALLVRTKSDAARTANATGIVDIRTSPPTYSQPMANPTPVAVQQSDRVMPPLRSV